MRRLILAFALCVLGGRAGAAQLPADARWSTIATPHFRVHFTAGLEPLARRAADRAERAHAVLAEVLIEPPRGAIDLVVSDNVDFSNGYAAPLPTNRIVVFATPPAGEPELAFYDDWLELVVAHELVHIFQLDYARGLPRAARSVFGRAPFTFPNLFTPSWTKEGLATVLESRLTRAGRVRGTLQEMTLRAAALEDAFFGIDRASGRPVSWPAGNTPYVYGAQFMEWLADRHGAAAHGRWVREAGGRVIPYRMDHTAREAYGESFTRAWSLWRDSLTAAVRAQGDSLAMAGAPTPEILVATGRHTEAPRWSPDGSTIAFSQSDGRSEAATRLIVPGGRPSALSPRTTLGPSAWISPDGLVTAMIDRRGPAGFHSDLYRLGLDGSRRRLTTGARLAEPDVHRPTGRIVAIRNGGGTTVPVVLDGEARTQRPLAEPSLDVHWAGPRWSPDGTRIAVSRWRPGAFHDLVVLDAGTGGVVREITRDRAVDAGAAWSPDGRYLLFSSDRSGVPELYAFDLQSGTLRQVTRVATGAFQPDVSPDGRWIAFTRYAADGYHLARIPFDPTSWQDPAPVRPEAAAGPGDTTRVTRAAGGAVRAYTPWPTLRPSAWTPLVEDGGELGIGIGAAVGAQDVITRHAYAARATLHPDGGRLNGSIGYLYAGLGRPVVGASVLQDWDALVVDPAGGLLLERERAASLVATWSVPRYRSFRWISVGAGVRDRDYSTDGAPDSLAVPVPAELGGAVTLGVSRTRGFDYSISAEEGWTAGITAEARRYLTAFPGEEARRGYLRASGRAQGYLPLAIGGFARHVLAARVQGGAVTGERAPAFRVGGLGGDAVGYPLSTFVSIGGALDLPVRGYPAGALSGDRAAAASLEYRFPIALVERGYRLAPVYLDRLWGAAWVDGAAAWCVETCPPSGGATPGRPRPLASLGAELGVDAGFLFLPPIGLRFGAAVPLRAVPTANGPGRRPDPELYFTLGRSF